MKRMSILLMILISPSLPVAAQVPVSAKDQLAIESVVLKWLEAWNRNDANALSVLLTDDVDFVSPEGAKRKGRGEFSSSFVRDRGIYATETVWTAGKTVVKLIRPEVAVAHVEWSTAGEKGTDGAARDPRREISTWTLERQNRRWLISASQNTKVAGPDEGCPATLKQYLRTTLYVGTSRYFLGDGWRRFTEEVLVKHLPAGGTVIENDSGWWRRPDGSTGMGGGRILIVLAPMTEIATHRAGIQAVIAEIKRVTGHLSVGWEEDHLCAGF